MKIKSIERAKHKRDGLLILLEDGTYLRATENELLRFNLTAGMDIPEDTLFELRSASRLSVVRAKAAEMLSKRPLSRSELISRLIEKGASESDAADAADRMQEIGALDDAEYAMLLVRKYASKSYGAARIRAKLYEKGVPEVLWDDALAELPNTDSQIDAYIERKMPLDGHPLNNSEKRRITAALLRRGFNYSEIHAAWARRNYQ